MNKFFALLTWTAAVAVVHAEVMIYSKLSPILGAETAIGAEAAVAGEAAAFFDAKRIPKDKQNEKVIIGILTLPLSPVLRNKMSAQLIENKLVEPDTDLLSYFADASYFPSSYAKWLKDQGADILPIDINDDLYSILEAVQAVDGLLLTGGAVPLYLHEKSTENTDDFSTIMELRQPSFYTRVIKEIIKLIKSINDKGRRVYPIWATCLGFESLVLNESSLDIALDRVHNEGYSNHLDFALKAEETHSRFYDFFAREKQLGDMAEKNLFYFNHENGFLDSHFASNEYLSANYNVVATASTKHKNGPRIVAVIENKRYPIFGVQFHPEKNKFEHHASVGADREQEALDICAEMARLFLSQVHKGTSRKTLQAQDWLLQERSMRYTLYVETNVGVFDEIYFFKKNGTN